MSLKLDIDDLLMCEFCRQKSQTYQDNDPIIVPCIDCDVKFNERLKVKLLIDSNQTPSKSMPIISNDEFFKNNIIQSLLKQLAQEYCALVEKIQIKISIIQEILKQRNFELDNDHTQDCLNEYIEDYRNQRYRFVEKVDTSLTEKCKQLFPDKPKSPDSLPHIYYKKPAIQMLIEPKPYFDYDELRKECVRLTQGYNQRYKYKIKELNVDELIEEPTIYPEILEELRSYLMNLQTPSFSRELVNYLLYTSRIRNWPSGFCAKDFVKLNINQFEDLKIGWLFF